MIQEVLLQKSPATDEFIDVHVFNAWYGFEKRGIPTRTFTWPEMLAENVELSRDVLVVGGILPVRTALERLGRPAPENIDYPESLREFLGREIRRATLKEAYALCVDDEVSPPVFMKPVTGHKEFDGHVLRKYRDLIRTSSFLGENPEVWLSEVVSFVSEFRYFVRRGTIEGVGHYRGDPLQTPNPSLVRRAVEKFENAPVAYTLDFGVLDDGRTALVEVNDGFAFGSYGLNPLAHSRMLEDRWSELVDLPLSFK